MTPAGGYGIREMGLGIIGFVHEFVLSEKAETLPILIFSLLVIQGIVIVAKRGRP